MLEALVAACTLVIWEDEDGVQEGGRKPFFGAPALDFRSFLPTRMTLVSIPANPVPEDVVTGTP